ncbi:heavy metal binding protein [Salinisphaera sp. LB1]|nr:heavy metal binding protein [Salinisphaera sp. LB1]
MSCQHCVAAVNEALAEVDGVERVVQVDLDSGVAEVEGDADTQALLAAVREEGYEATMA